MFMVSEGDSVLHDFHYESKILQNDENRPGKILQHASLTIGKCTI